MIAPSFSSAFLCPSVVGWPCGSSSGEPAPYKTLSGGGFSPFPVHLLMSWLNATSILYSSPTYSTITYTGFKLLIRFTHSRVYISTSISGPFCALTAAKISVKNGIDDFITWFYFKN